MPTSINLIRLSFCGPSDVLKEIEIGREVVNQWNRNHSEGYSLWVHDKHWSSDAHPEMGDRPQAIINSQIIDNSDIIVAIFWRRFGSPTGIAGSGTEEEIRRATRLGKKAMVYFSDREAIAGSINQAQFDLLWQFRQNLRTNFEGLCWNFASHAFFKKEFERHLAHALMDFRSAPTSISQPKASEAANQTIHGNHNIQAGGDVSFFQNPPAIKNIIERREGSVSPSDLRQIQLWIEELVESTVGMARKQAFAMWSERFKNRFDIDKREELASEKMTGAHDWFIEQRAILKRRLKTKLPEEWRRSRIVAIKAAMTNMQKQKEVYYPEIAQRLRIRKPFVSLKDLTKKDLERVYTLVLRDAGET
ncbi:hypothetical protein OH491_19645 [Termitidicoccus mucosus]|uniref:hypothetical protein n=1 Tax=Termitidicoccus mucosus TaxID=1184151 RepID=UPI003183969C